MEEKDFPGLGRRGEVVGQPPALRRIIAKRIIRIQSVLIP
jgi:hypothetical protein